MPKCKKVFWGYVFFCFLVVLFFCCLCFCACVLQKGPQRLFSCNFRGFCLFCSPKRPVLKCFFSSFSVFFPGFPFSSLSKFHFFFFVFCPSTPFWKRFFVGGFFLSFYFVFSFLNVGFFVWSNFLTSPFWTPSCFCFWHFFCCFSFCFHGVCFCLSVLMLALFCYVFILFWFCFYLVSCFLLSDYEKNIVFPAILVFFVVLALK